MDKFLCCIVVSVVLCSVCVSSYVQEKKGKAVDPEKTLPIILTLIWKLVIPVGCLYLKHDKGKIQRNSGMFRTQRINPGIGT